MSRRPPYPIQRKSLGQVFLRTDWPVQRVIDRLKALHVQRVLEIGPGDGVLTKGLLRAGFEVTAVEKDERFYERILELKKRYPGVKFDVENADILGFDLGEWLEKSAEVAAVVGNIPYNISSPIILWLMPYLDRLSGACLMVQLEFACRLLAKSGTKDYGSLSVYMQLRSKVEMECKVDRTCFSPVPKVDSAIVAITSRRIPEVSAKLLERVEAITRMAFTQRRKMLRNSIRAFLDVDKESRCPIDLDRRAETLRPEEFVDLTRYLSAAEI